VPPGQFEILTSPVADETWERIRQAAIDLVLAHGYDGFELDDLCARAGVSRAEFDARFSNRRECLDLTYEANIAEFDQATFSPYLQAPNWREGLRAAAYGSAMYLRGHSRELRYGELRRREGGALEQTARDRYLQRVVDLIDAGRSEARNPEALGRATAESILGSIYELAVKRLAGSGDDGPTLEIVPELMYIAVRPYLGHEAALEELTMPVPPSLSALEASDD
jgi:AcrR family transcriptional regulator